MQLDLIYFLWRRISSRCREPNIAPSSLPRNFCLFPAGQCMPNHERMHNHNQARKCVSVGAVVGAKCRSTHTLARAARDRDSGWPMLETSDQPPQRTQMPPRQVRFYHPHRLLATPPSQRAGRLRRRWRRGWSGGDRFVSAGALWWTSGSPKCGWQPGRSNPPRSRHPPDADGRLLSSFPEFPPFLACPPGHHLGSGSARPSAAGTCSRIASRALGSPSSPRARLSSLSSA